MTRDLPNAPAEKSALPRVGTGARRPPTSPPHSQVEECLRGTAAEMAYSRVGALADAVTDSGESGDLDATSRNVVRQAVPALADLTQEADRRKTESLSILAHELRNPLAVIRQAVAVLRRCGKDEAAVCSAQDVIDNQVTHMARLVNDLSEVSRLANGKTRLELEPLDLATVVRDAAEASRPLIDARMHRLTVRTPQEPLVVNADRIRLSQVLVNLLNNAAKYTPPGGSLSLSLEREEGEAVFRVCDNGVGIPAKALPKIFDMFMQVDQSVGLSQGGLGIGLTLVRRFVEMHGGRVSAASGGVNCGSEFTVRLPLLLAPQFSRASRTAWKPPNGASAQSEQ